MSDLVPASTATPDPILVISYEEGLRHVQHRLSSFIHGDLKPWTEQQQLNYSMVVNLKNGRIAGPTPRLIQKIMRALGFDLHAKRVRRNSQFIVEFSLNNTIQIENFRSQANQ